MSLPKVPWSERLGHIGELEIKKRLLCFSTASKYEFDAGIDFYCELLIGDSPTIPFYVQAKGTEHFDDNWGQSIDKTTLLYWLYRDFPVFLIVYDKPSGTCYWVSLEDKRHDLLNKMRGPSNSIYLKVDRSNILYDARDKNHEFTKKVIESTDSIQMWKGAPQAKGAGYVKQIPGPPRSPQEVVNISESTRMNLYSLIQHYWNIGDLETAFKSCRFLAEFDRSHYNHFVWLGEIAYLRGDRDGAREALKEALDICERDKVWPRGSMDQLKASIRMRLESI